MSSRNEEGKKRVLTKSYSPSKGEENRSRRDRGFPPGAGKHVSRPLFSCRYAAAAPPGVETKPSSQPSAALVCRLPQVGPKRTAELKAADPPQATVTHFLPSTNITPELLQNTIKSHFLKIN